MGASSAGKASSAIRVCTVPGCAGRIVEGPDGRGQIIAWCVACERRVLQLRWLAEQGRAAPPLEPPVREVAAIAPAAPPAPRSRQRLSRGDLLLAAIPSRQRDAVTTRELAERVGDTLVRVSTWLSFHWESAGLRRERRTGNKGIAYAYWRPAGPREVPSA